MARTLLSRRSILATFSMCGFALLIMASPAHAQHHGPPHPTPPQHHNPPKNTDRGNFPGQGNGNGGQFPGQGNGNGGTFPGHGNGVQGDVVAAPDAPMSAAATARAANRASQVAAALRNGQLPAPRGGTLPTAAQLALAGIVLSSPQGNAAPALVQTLAPADNAGAQPQAAALVESLRGLLQHPQQLRRSVVAYNAFVQASSDEFLARPPAELDAIRAVLAPLAQAAAQAPAGK